MHAFIVRPFGTKQEVNFDKVEQELIQPALEKAGITGSTTAAIVEAGNIREDMFSSLLTADLVIADVSIHNANVFYELGIRHALRDKRTFLLRCSKDEIPFDLKTDRYLSYNADDPAGCLEQLIAGIKATLLSERKDSPVFSLLPQLEAQDPERFLAVPPDFIEEAEIARASKQPAILALLATEAKGFHWEMLGLRIIGEMQYKMKVFEDARQSWEKVRQRYPADNEANDRLATIYQRLAEIEMQLNQTEGWELLTKSDLAIERLLAGTASLNNQKKAEVYSLKGCNFKTRWLVTWLTSPVIERQAKALQSPFLKQAFENYDWGYQEDLNHFYSGINSLALLTVILALAEQNPGIWELEYDSADDAAYELKKYKEHRQKLVMVVEASLQAHKKRLAKEGKTDPWLTITEADYSCLVNNKPERVASMYRKAITQSTEENFDSAKRQLEIYKQLGILNDNCTASLTEFTAKEDAANKKKHYILFTGHMIDKADRPLPRFPAEKESVARAAIKAALENELKKIDDPVVAIAGGACGGDIIFHEVCHELGVQSELYLALPREEFIRESVQFAGSDWIERFNRLYKKGGYKILSDTKELPKWLTKKTAYNIWERSNLWMLYSSLACGGMQMTMVALWDGKSGDGAGGTEHMVKVANDRGAHTIIINTQTTFGLV